jgi:hypothetical protein
MAAIHSTIRRPFAGMARSYKRLATRQRSLTRRSSIAHTKSLSWHLHSWCAWRTLAALVT